jgi:hypothetical protein
MEHTTVCKACRFGLPLSLSSKMASRFLPWSMTLYCARCWLLRLAAARTLNGRAIRVSLKPWLRTAVVATAIPPTGASSPREQTQALDQLKELCQRVFVVRQMGLRRCSLRMLPRVDWMAIGR